MLVTSDGEFSSRITIQYWREMVQENEKLRFSQHSKEAFRMMRDIYKYNQFDKRDGSIVSKVLEGEVVVNDEKQVNALLIEHLKSVQWDPSQRIYEENPPEPFPVLEAPSIEEMNEILGIITTNKAFTADLVSDSILAELHWERSCNVLKDLWSGLIIDEVHFRCRLIALNKKHPLIPKKDQFRPIIITSLLVKILEARLVKPLKQYMINKLHISQTGFVPGMDISVNLCRLLTSLSEYREKGVRSFLLFLDFSSAYNTVLHDKLFHLLEKKNVLTVNEIQLLKAIYSRVTIELGDERFQPNVGVAQGSLISPFLFNIYAEGLLDDLTDEGWRERDLYGFADDHLVRSGSLLQLEKAIGVVERWCLEYNIKLNPSKSGILEIFPKYKAGSMRIGSHFRGIPVVEKYKYLGVWLDQKLSCRSHLEYLFGSNGHKQHQKKVRGKVDFLINSLNPCFKDISVDYAINLWLTFVKPLFIPLTALSVLTSISEKELVQSKLRTSLKKFLKLPKNFKTEILFQIYPIDFIKWMKIERENSRAKWEARKLKEDVRKDNLKKFTVPFQKYLPAEFRSLIKKFTAWCKTCNKPFYPDHLEDHGIRRIQMNEILEDLKNIEGNLGTGSTDTRIGPNRIFVISAFSDHFKAILAEVDQVLQEHAKVFNK